jgi:hypothetical protein
MSFIFLFVLDFKCTHVHILFSLYIKKRVFLQNCSILYYLRPMVVKLGGHIVDVHTKLQSI